MPCTIGLSRLNNNDNMGRHFGAHAAEDEEGKHLGQQEAVSVQDGVAALPQRSLSAEVCDDVDQAGPQALHRHAVRDALQQPQGVHIPPNVVHQLTCSRTHPRWLSSQHALFGHLWGPEFDAAQQGKGHVHVQVSNAQCPKEPQDDSCSGCMCTMQLLSRHHSSERKMISRRCKLAMRQKSCGDLGHASNIGPQMYMFA